MASKTLFDVYYTNEAKYPQHGTWTGTVSILQNIQKNENKEKDLKDYTHTKDDTMESDAKVEAVDSGGSSSSSELQSASFDGADDDSCSNEAVLASSENIECDVAGVDDNNVKTGITGINDNNIKGSESKEITFKLNSLLDKREFVAITSGHGFDFFYGDGDKLNTSCFRILLNMWSCPEPKSRATQADVTSNKKGFFTNEAADMLKDENGTQIFVPYKLDDKYKKSTKYIDFAVIVSNYRDEIDRLERIEFSTLETLEETRQLFKVSTQNMYDGYNANDNINVRKSVVSEQIMNIGVKFIHTNGSGMFGSSGSFGVDYLGRAATLWSGLGSNCGRHQLISQEIVDETDLYLYTDYVANNVSNLKSQNIAVVDMRSRLKKSMMHAERWGLEPAAAASITDEKKAEEIHKTPTLPQSSAASSDSTDAGNIDYHKEFLKTLAKTQVGYH